MMTNQSGLEPLGHAVLVKMRDMQKPGGKIELPKAVLERSTVMEDQAVIVAVGKNCWVDEFEQRAMPGDTVIVTKFAGYVVQGPQDQQLYRLVNDRDVFCRVTAEVAS